MKKFLVLYLAPYALMDEWMQTDDATRKGSEEKMMADWKEWTREHADIFVDEGGGTGKVKRVTEAGTKDARNDLMLYAIIQAGSHEEAAAIFESHPHLEIPQASIEIMPISPMLNWRE